MVGRFVAAEIAVALILTGCGVRVRSSSTPGSDAYGQAHDQVGCGGTPYSAASLADAPPLSSLLEGPAGAVDDVGAPALDRSQDWRVVHQNANRVDLVRELEEPVDNGGGDVRAHESRTVERITGASNVPDGTWLLTSAGSCVQRLVADGGLGEADVTLADAPSPQGTALVLLVREWACASGRSAEGRIEVVELQENAEQVRLRLAPSRAVAAHSSGRRRHGTGRPLARVGGRHRAAVT